MSAWLRGLLVLALLASATAASGAVGMAAQTRPADTWVPLAALPEAAQGPVLALAANPADPGRLLVGTASGSIYQSRDGGSSWTRVQRGLGRGVTALAFDPLGSQTVLAGTRGDGVWRSQDGGQSWRADPGTAGRTIRAFGFSSGVEVAGTDQGVLVQRQGGGWTQAGLSQLAVTSVATALAHDPARLLVGGDAISGAGASSQTVAAASTASSSGQLATQAVPLFTSGDGGQTWAAVSGTVGGSSIVSALAAVPQAAAGSQPVLMGTNAGLFSSNDSGATWQPITGEGTLPATDVSALVYAPGAADRYYVASDGGVSENGGLWVTRDAGGQFSALRPPVPAVTALAVSGSTDPVLYIATIRPGDQQVTLWSYRDAGGPPQGVQAGGSGAGGAAAQRAAGGGRTATHPAGAGAGTGAAWLASLLRGPEAPYLGLATAALLVLAAAMVAYLRRARDL